MNTIPYLIIFLGSGIGGAIRHGVNELVSYHLGSKFPYGIMMINITGALLLGLLAGYFAFKGEASQHWRLFLMVGICGGYTTFSTFSQDAALLIERGQLSLAATYIIGSVVLSILGFFLGMWVIRQI